jgi:hypothetical protein
VLTIARPSCSINDVRLVRIITALLERFGAMKTVAGILLLAFAAAPDAHAAEMPWKAGLATVRITPEIPVPMAGYASRTKPFERVEQDIYAKALALEDGEGHRAVLVTTDLLGLSRAVAEPVCERIQEATKLVRSQILLNSAHTHSAPMLGDPDRTESGVAPEDALHIVAYTRSLQDKLVQVATQAWSRLEPAQLSWGSGVAHFAMNRREFTPRGVILGVNARGLVDRTVPVLRIDTAEGKLRAILFGYACHNTTLTQTNYNLCGDYAGFAQAFIEERQPGAQSMFMIGCGGDANPYPRGTMADARENGATLGREVCRVLDGPLRPLHGPLTCVFDQARLPLQQLTRAELERMTNGPSWQAGNAKAMLAKLDRGEKLAMTYEAPVAVWQFGSDLTLVGLSGEVVVDYVPLIERAIGPLQLWISAYCNDVFGYFPSARVLQEGGYECRGLYTTEGFFAPSAQDALVTKVRELAQRAGRKPPDTAEAPLRKPPAELAECFKPPEQYRSDFGNFRSPLIFADGTSVLNPVDWPRRRAEILSTWHKIMVPWPPLIERPRVEVVNAVRRENIIQQQLRIEIALGEEMVDALILLPEGKAAGARRPAILVTYYDAETGAGLDAPFRDYGWQLAKRGFVALSIGKPNAHIDLTSTNRPRLEPYLGPVGKLVRVQPLSALAYAAANAHTVLAQRPDVDPSRIGIVGHSFGGKWAMFASGLYDKFACAVWSDPGIVFDERNRRQQNPNGSVNYWDVWYLGFEPGAIADPKNAGPFRKLPTEGQPRTGAYQALVESGHDLVELHALMAPRPFLVSGGTADLPERWPALNHTIAVNKLLGYADRVAMTARDGHTPTQAANEQVYRFFEWCLGARP